MYAGKEYVVCEGNVQPPPYHPTNFADWRIWLWDSREVRKLNVRTHHGSRAVANPSAVVVPAPGAADTAGLVLVVTYFVFSEGAAKGEQGPLVFYTTID